MNYTEKHYSRAKVEIPERERNKPGHPATHMHGLAGRVLEGWRGLGECALFWPDGPDSRKYEFVPRKWITTGG